MNAKRRTYDTYHGKVPIVAGDVRHRILSGEYRAGMRLPTRLQLASQFGVSSLTVQRAMRQLTEDGFVVSRGKGGSFVADNPPHLTRYALMFPYLEDDPAWSRWFEAVLRECAVMRAKGTALFIVSGYDSVTGHEDYRNLVAEVQAERVAGLIFTTTPKSLIGTPVLETPGLPRVAFMDVPMGNGVSAITLDGDMFVRQSLDYLQAQGRRRPAVLLHAEVKAEGGERFREEAAARGMICPTRWIHGVPLWSAGWAENVVQLLLDPGNADRPDSLIVADDNLLEAASRAVAASGLRVPEDFTVVAHANFPWPTPSCVPAKRFGMDVRRFLRTAVDMIDAQRQHRRAPRRIVLPSVEESAAAP